MSHPQILHLDNAIAPSEPNIRSPEPQLWKKMSHPQFLHLDNAMAPSEPNIRSPEPQLRKKMSHPQFYIWITPCLHRSQTSVSQSLSSGHKKITNSRPQHLGRDSPKKKPILADEPFIYLLKIRSYIIPPMPPPGGIIGIGASSFISFITHSVVNTIPAIEAAFSTATLVTLVGSITPAFLRSS